MANYNKLVHPNWCKSFGVHNSDPKIQASTIELRLDECNRQRMEEREEFF
jgi:hypothetical protein